ncbi:MAG: hydrolase [Anaerolineae bacterium CG2_30_57_67]|nr:MAG: hydrolase [Anaerolineae bacterium CG2_30_57_67]
MKIITHATLVRWTKPNEILNDSALVIENGKIADFGPSAELEARYPLADRWDARGQLLMPGNICAHTHFYGMYARGLAVPGPAAENFSQILKTLWWPLDQALDEEAVRLSTRVCLADAIRHGTTTLFDHHASPNFLTGSLNAIAQEVEKSGLRATLCYEVTDRYGEEKMRAAIAENVDFIRKTADGKRPTLRGVMGLHAPLTVSTATLAACVAAADALDTGLHLHVSESLDDGYAALTPDKGFMPPVDWLAHNGALGPKSIAAHAVQIDEREIQLLAETQTWVTHQPRSNMNNAVGVTEVEQMLDRGVHVCLGNDGFSNAMWAEWNAAYLLHKIHHEDPRRMDASRVVEMAIDNNAALTQTFFPEAPIGVIEKGAAADLILVDYQPPTPLTAGNLPWHILFGFREGMVTATIVNGKILMKDRQLLTLDETEIAAQARAYAPKVWETYRKIAENQ